MSESAEHALTPATYIGHHLTFLKQPVGDGGSFWTLHVDTLLTSAVLGIIVFARGIATVAVDAAIWIGIMILALAVMRLVAGPDAGDRLGRWRRSIGTG